MQMQLYDYVINLNSLFHHNHLYDNSCKPQKWLWYLIITIMKKIIQNAYLTIGSMCYFVNIIEISTEWLIAMW
jgi:hypothetical protein